MMDKSTRRALPSSVDASGEPKWQPAKLSDLSEQLADGYAGVRNLQVSPWETSADLPLKEEDLDWESEPVFEQIEGESSRAKVEGLLPAFAIFVFAALIRLVFLFVITDPNEVIPTWSNDTFHHWQVAYMSKEVGFSEGFLRLWDLKGLEYFWGALHPLLLAASFSITGSVDLIIPRLLSLAAGSANVAFIYLLGRKFWSVEVGLAAALLSALNPIVIFNDPSGMVEPFGLVFLLAGIYFYPNRSFVAGLMWAMAAMARAEAWLFSIGLVIAAMLGSEQSDRKIGLAVGWAVPMLFYMKYLLDWTGNAIYPLYWNFLANAAGEWVDRVTLTTYQQAARPVLVLLFLLSLLAGLWALWKKPRGYLFHLLGFGSTAFITGFIGLTAYLTGYETWFWLTRFFVFQYMFLGLLVVVLLLEYLPQKVKWTKSQGLGWAGVLAVLAMLQLTWPAVLYDVSAGYTNPPKVSSLRKLAEIVRSAYDGGTVLIPEDVPHRTYAIVRYAGIEGENILGQMYGPTYYYQGTDLIADWNVVGPEMWDWFRAEDIRVLVTYANDVRFQQMIGERPESFTLVGTSPESALEIYKVSLP